MSDKAQVIVLDTDIRREYMTLIQLKARLKLETVGLKVSRGQTAYAMAKQLYKLKGNKASVLAQVEELVQKKQLQLQAENIVRE